MGRNSPDYWHLFIEAKKLAYADRAQYFGDPAHHKLPVAELISKDYAARQRKRIDIRHAAISVNPGDPLLGKKGDTIYLCVVDKDRNCCSLIQSNYWGFGSYVVPGKTGFVIQNRGSQFSLNPQHVNSLEPHKRPFHTIIPAMATKDGKPWLCFGVMGGDFQPQGHTQVLVNMIDFGLDVQAAGDAGRIRHDGSQTPTGQSMSPLGGTLDIESGIPEATVVELLRRGHQIDRKGGDTFGGYEGIWIDQKHGTLWGGTEPRKDGAAGRMLERIDARFSCPPMPHTHLWSHQTRAKPSGRDLQWLRSSRVVAFQNGNSASRDDFVHAFVLALHVAAVFGNESDFPGRNPLVAVRCGFQNEVTVMTDDDLPSGSIRRNERRHQVTPFLSHCPFPRS